MTLVVGFMIFVYLGPVKTDKSVAVFNEEEFIAVWTTAFCKVVEVGF